MQLNSRQQLNKISQMQHFWVDRDAYLAENYEVEVIAVTGVLFLACSCKRLDAQFNSRS
jgi:hypothetical protein